MNQLLGGKQSHGSGHGGGHGSNPLGLAGQLLGGLSGGGHGSGGHGGGSNPAGKLVGALASSVLSSNKPQNTTPQNYHGGPPQNQPHHSGGLAGTLMGGVASMFGGGHHQGQSVSACRARSCDLMRTGKDGYMVLTRDKTHVKGPELWLLQHGPVWLVQRPGAAGNVPDVWVAAVQAADVGPAAATERIWVASTTAAAPDAAVWCPAATVAAVRRCPAAGPTSLRWRPTPAALWCTVALRRRTATASAAAAAAALCAASRLLPWRTATAGCVRGTSSARWPRRLQPAVRRNPAARSTAVGI